MCQSWCFFKTKSLFIFSPNTGAHKRKCLYSNFLYFINAKLFQYSAYRFTFFPNIFITIWKIFLYKLFTLPSRICYSFDHQYAINTIKVLKFKYFNSFKLRILIGINVTHDQKLVYWWNIFFSYKVVHILLKYFIINHNILWYIK